MKAPFGWRCSFRASEDVSQGGASNGRQKSKGVLFCRVCQGLPFTLPWVVGHRSISLPTKLAAHRGVSVPPAALRRHVRVPGALPRLAWTDPPLSFPFRAMFGTVLTIRQCCCFAKRTRLCPSSTAIRAPHTRRLIARLFESSKTCICLLSPRRIEVNLPPLTVPRAVKESCLVLAWLHVGGSCLRVHKCA